jgi:hypothetical protein
VLVRGGFVCIIANVRTVERNATPNLDILNSWQFI